MLWARYKAPLNRLLDPLARQLAALGVSPNAITLAIPLLTLAACGWVLQTRAVPAFCFLMGGIGCLDVLDGAVARVSGRTSRTGAYLDAMGDRYVEVFVVATGAIISGYWLLHLLVISGALLVSYAKARAAMEVPVSNQEWPDLMERGERAALYLLGWLTGATCPWQPAGRDLFWWALVLLALLTHVTAGQRLIRAAGLIRTRSGG
jgi:phosphatidylglycerophosphate synthase